MARKRSHKVYLQSELSPFEPYPMGWSQLLAWVYPSSYEVGMANIGYQWLYGHLRAHQFLFTGRFFYEKHPLSLEDDRPLKEFPIIAVSLPYEIDGLNFIEMLKAAGIEPLAKKRGRTPLVIGGGDALTLNPFPFADFFDMIVLGDGESWARQFPYAIKNMPPGLVSKDQIFDVCREIEGVWITSRGDGGEIHRACPGRELPAYSPILTSFGHFRNMFLVEAQRGCAFKCAFCASSWLDEPFYNYSPNAILSTFEKHGQDASRVGLVGSAIAEHDCLPEIIEGFDERGVSVHLSSIRLDRISRQTMELLAETGSKSITFAPETASESIAKKIGKWIPPEEIIEQAKRLVKFGFSEMKLYWIVGLPEESEGDIIELSKAIEQIAAATDMRISCSVNSFIPKPHSRFSMKPMLSHGELSKRFSILKKRLSKIDNLQLEINYSRRSRLSAVMSIGGKELSKAILNMSESGIKRSLKDIGIELDDEISAKENPAWRRII